MGRLIDAERLINNIKEELKTAKDINTKIVLGLMISIVACQPTAYDVEKVVAELEALPNREADYYYASSNDVIDREDAIDIVRKGGVE